MNRARPMAARLINRYAMRTGVYCEISGNKIIDEIYVSLYHELNRVFGFWLRNVYQPIFYVH